MWNNFNPNTQKVHNNILSGSLLLKNISLAPSCNTCEKSVRDRSSITCNLCYSKVHLKCNYLNYVDSRYI